MLKPSVLLRNDDLPRRGSPAPAATRGSPQASRKTNSSADWSPSASAPWALPDKPAMRKSMVASQHEGATWKRRAQPRMSLRLAQDRGGWRPPLADDPHETATTVSAKNAWGEIRRKERAEGHHGSLTSLAVKRMHVKYATDKDSLPCALVKVFASEQRAECKARSEGHAVLVAQYQGLPGIKKESGASAAKAACVAAKYEDIAAIAPPTTPHPRKPRHVLSSADGWYLLYESWKDECPYCRVLVRRTDFHSHISHECPFRPVECKLCRAIVFGRDIENHPMECPEHATACHLCGEMVKNKDSKGHVGVCVNRPVPCPHCCVLHPFCKLEAHKDVCPAAPLICKHCGSTVARELMKMHVQTDCPARPVECHLCGESVHYHDLSSHRRETCPERETHCVHCGLRGKGRDVAEHEVQCPRRPVQCDACSAPMYASQLDRHRGECPRRLVECPSCGEKVTADNLDRHRKSTCPHRLEQCPYCRAFYDVDTLESHLGLGPSPGTLCESVPMNCHGCNTIFTLAKLAHHGTEDCIERTLTCQACSAKIKAKSIEYHTFQECPHPQVRHCAHCDTKVPLVRLESHEAACELHPVVCDRCSASVVRHDLPAHLRRRCGEKGDKGGEGGPADMGSDRGSKGTVEEAS